jgi:hypothetical protein
MIFAVVFMSRKCTNYTCEKVENNTKTCAAWVDEGYKITSCQKDYTCQLDKDGNGTCIKTEEIKNKLAGEYCKDNKQCISNNCKDKVCGGKADGSCEKHSDCDVELHCFKGKCTESTGKCDLGNDTLCKSNEVCNKKKCIPQGSLEDGASADSPIACKSWYLNKTNYCAKGPVLQKEKKDKDVCTYKIGEKSIYNDSKVCIKNKEGSSYCAEGKGSMNMSTVSLSLSLVRELYEF